MSHKSAANQLCCAHKPKLNLTNASAQCRSFLPTVKAGKQQEHEQDKGNCCHQGAWTCLLCDSCWWLQTEQAGTKRKTPAKAEKPAGQAAAAAASKAASKAKSPAKAPAKSPAKAAKSPAKAAAPKSKAGVKDVDAKAKAKRKRQTLDSDSEDEFQVCSRLSHQMHFQYMQFFQGAGKKHINLAAFAG